MKKMCKRDHREMTSRVLASLVESSGGSEVCECSECTAKYLVTYAGPSGLFCSITEVE